MLEVGYEEELKIEFCKMTLGGALRLHQKKTERIMPSLVATTSALARTTFAPKFNKNDHAETNGQINIDPEAHSM